METISLELIPSAHKKITLELVPENRWLRAETLLKEQKDFDYVFSDEQYSVNLIGLNEDRRIQRAELTVNGEKRNVYPSLHGGWVIDNMPSVKLFENCFGFADLSLELLYSEEEDSRFLFSKPLSVLVKEDHFSIQASNMVAYVSENIERLRTGDLEYTTENGKHTQTSVSDRLALVREIVITYERLYGFFRTNPQKAAVPIERVTDIRHFSKVTSNTVGYIAAHPETLQRVYTRGGISIGGRSYLPQKVLSGVMVFSTDIYENSVVVSFIRTLINYLGKAFSDANSLIEDIPGFAIPEEAQGYIVSTSIIYSRAREALREHLSEIQSLRERLAVIWEMYQNVLPATEKDILYVPQNSPIFSSVPQYRTIYMYINKWFGLLPSDFFVEKYLLSFMRMPEVYEHYSILKIMDYLEDEGFVLKESKTIEYEDPRPVTDTGRNLFVFVSPDEEQTISIYRQPIIWDYDTSEETGLELYRNSSFRLEGGKSLSQNNYYCPDYVVKAEFKGRTLYYIGDAKYAAISSVERNHTIAVAFKYLVSISTISAKSEVKGVFLNYGKVLNSEKGSLFDKQIGQITPAFDIVPLSDGAEDTMKSFIKSILLLSGSNLIDFTYTGRAPYLPAEGYLNRILA